MLLILILI